MKIIHLLTLLIFVFTSCEKDNDELAEVAEDDPVTIKDIDGNIYHTVRIGTQLWLVENLKTTRFQNGDLINELDESNSNISSYVSYQYDPNLSEVYGYLYNRNAVRDERKISPKGWHIPSDEEWNILLEYVDNKSEKIKIKGSTHWTEGNSDATNESGFTALPGGEYNFAFKRFGFMGIEANWWMSENLNNMQDVSNHSRFNLRTDSDRSSMSYITFHEGNMYSIRCIRD